MRRRHIRTASRYGRTADTVGALCHTRNYVITTVAEGDAPEFRGVVEVDLEHTQLLGWCGKPEPGIIFGAATVDAGIGDTSSRLEVRAWHWNIGQVNGWSTANGLADADSVQLRHVAVEERVEYLVRGWTRRNPLGPRSSTVARRRIVTMNNRRESSNRER